MLAFWFFYDDTISTSNVKFSRTSRKMCKSHQYFSGK